MMIRCTRNLPEYVKAEVGREATRPSNRFGDWYAKRLSTKRGKLVRPVPNAKARFFIGSLLCFSGSGGGGPGRMPPILLGCLRRHFESLAYLGPI